MAHSHSSWQEASVPHHEDLSQDRLRVFTAWLWHERSKQEHGRSYNVSYDLVSKVTSIISTISCWLHWTLLLMWERPHRTRITRRQDLWRLAAIPPAADPVTVYQSFSTSCDAAALSCFSSFPYTFSSAASMTRLLPVAFVMVLSKLRLSHECIHTYLYAGMTP